MQADKKELDARGFFSGRDDWSEEKDFMTESRFSRPAWIFSRLLCFSQPFSALLTRWLSPFWDQGNQSAKALGMTRQAQVFLCSRRKPFYRFMGRGSGNCRGVFRRGSLINIYAGERIFFHPLMASSTLIFLCQQSILPVIPLVRITFVRRFGQQLRASRLDRSLCYE